MSRVADQSLSWYRLFCVKGLGPKRLHLIHKALAEYGISADDLLLLDRDRFQRLLPGLGGSVFEAIHNLNYEQVTEDYHRLTEKGIKVIHLGHEDYPELIVERMHDSAPPVLFTRGYVRLLRSEGVAIVGSRHASAEGLALAARVAEELAAQGLNVVSGYAKGIDTEAHLGALRRDGTTTIVLSSGILEFSRKRTDAELDWERSALVVSQFHLAERWSARNAMTRNKLVCALSQAVVVIGAGEERDAEGRMSGTFDAGKTALPMKVPLFVVDPGTFTTPPAGNAKLIERGGVSVTPANAVAEIVRRFRGEVVSPRDHTEAPRKQQSFIILRGQEHASPQKPLAATSAPRRRSRCRPGCAAP
jgi:DNA processing protein